LKKRIIKERRDLTAWRNATIIAENMNATPICSPFSMPSKKMKASDGRNVARNVWNADFMGYGIFTKL